MSSRASAFATRGMPEPKTQPTYESSRSSAPATKRPCEPLPSTICAATPTGFAELKSRCWSSEPERGRTDHDGTYVRGLRRFRLPAGFEGSDTFREQSSSSRSTTSSASSPSVSSLITPSISVSQSCPTTWRMPRESALTRTAGSGSSRCFTKLRIKRAPRPPVIYAAKSLSVPRKELTSILTLWVAIFSLVIRNTSSSCW